MMITIAIWKDVAIYVSPDVIHGRTSIFSPHDTPSHSVLGLSNLVLSFCLGIFLVVGGLVLYALIRFRHRPIPTLRGSQRRFTAALRSNFHGRLFRFSLCSCCFLQLRESSIRPSTRRNQQRHLMLLS